MIVRISNENVFELDDAHHDALNVLDDATVAAVEGDDEDRYRESFGELLAFVREKGTILGSDDLHASDVILPPRDLTFAEAQQEFTGEGLVPDPPETATT